MLLYNQCYVWSNHLSSIANLSLRVSESGLAETWSEKLEDAVSNNIMFNSVLKNINLATNFGSSVTGKQMGTVTYFFVTDTGAVIHLPLGNR